MDNKLRFPGCIRYILRFHNLSLSYNRVLSKFQEAEYDDTTLHEVHESLLLKHVTEWELFCTSLLSYCVSLDTSKLSKFLCLELPNKIAVDNATAILNGINMLSIRTTRDLKKVASNIVVNRPSSGKLKCFRNE